MPFRMRSMRVVLLVILLPVIMEAGYDAGWIQRCCAVVLQHLVEYSQLQDVFANALTLSAAEAFYLQALRHTESQDQDLYGERLLARLGPIAHHWLLFRDHDL